MTNLSQPEPNISWIGEGCDTVGMSSLPSPTDNQWATAGFLVNSSPVKPGIRRNPLFLFNWNTILPMTPPEDCVPPRHDLEWDRAVIPLLEEKGHGVNQ